MGIIFKRYFLLKERSYIFIFFFDWAISDYHERQQYPNRTKVHINKIPYIWVFMNKKKMSDGIMLKANKISINNNNIEMGFKFSKTEQKIVVSTVNYSGILLSPFEFYSENYCTEEEALSQCFRQLLAESVKDYEQRLFRWNIGKIDVKIQKERYTPIYRREVGIENGRFVNEGEFRQRWKQCFEAALGESKMAFGQEQITNMQNFDLLCYKSIIYYLYRLKDLSKVGDLEIDSYINFMQKYYSKSFLNEQKKQQMALIGMKQSQVDVFFFQQANQQWISTLQSTPQYITCKGLNSSIVVLRKNKFKKIYNTKQIFQIFPQEVRKNFNWNDDTVYCFADSSKKQKNSIQKQRMLQQLNRLALHFPMCQIIVGGDANSFISPDKIPKKFNIYPRNKQSITTMKKRTWLQPQFEKKDQLSAEVKDCILSTLTISKERITTLPGANSNTVKYIPNMEHPCDHFVVTVEILK